jgi:hypothetical protein
MEKNSMKKLFVKKKMKLTNPYVIQLEKIEKAHIKSEMKEETLYYTQTYKVIRNYYESLDNKKKLMNF